MDIKVVRGPLPLFVIAGLVLICSPARAQNECGSNQVLAKAADSNGVIHQIECWNPVTKQTTFPLSPVTPFTYSFFGNTANPLTALIDPTTIRDAAGNLIRFSNAGSFTLSIGDFAGDGCGGEPSAGEWQCADVANDVLTMSGGNIVNNDVDGDGLYVVDSTHTTSIATSTLAAFSVSGNQAIGTDSAGDQLSLGIGGVLWKLGNSAGSAFLRNASGNAILAHGALTIDNLVSCTGAGCGSSPLPPSGNGTLTQTTDQVGGTDTPGNFTQWDGAGNTEDAGLGPSNAADTSVAMIASSTTPVTGHGVNFVVTGGGNVDLVDSGNAPALILSGTTGSIGGSLLTPGTCATGTASVGGATTAMTATASPVTYPGDGNIWEAYVSAPGVVTVKVCPIVSLTPTASTYRVRAN